MATSNEANIASLTETICETLPSGVIVQAEGGTIVYANRAAERILGMTRDQMEGRTSLDPRWRSIHEDGSPYPGEQHPTMRALQTGLPQHDAVMGIHKPDGDLTWILIYAEPLFRPGESRPWGALAQFFDSTSSKAASDALLGANVAFRGLIEDLNGIIWEADGGTMRFTFVSAQAERILGYPLSMWYSGPRFWVEHIHPDDRDWAIAFCTRETAAGRLHEFEYRMIAADGRVVWLKDRVTVVARPDAAPLLRGIMLDVTARRVAQDEAERNRLLLRSILDASTDLIFVKDRDRRLIAVNSAYAEALGRTPEDSVGKIDYVEMGDPGILSTWMEEDARTLAGEVVRNPTDAAIIRGERRNFDTIKTPLRDRDGNVAGIVGISRDVTERQRLEKALVAARAAGTAGRIAGTAAHDINNPLAALLTQIELLQQDLAGHPGATETLAAMRAQVARIERTVGTLVGFARLRSQARGLVPTAEVLRNASALFAQTYASRGITLEVSCDAMLPAVRATPEELQEVVVVFLENGRDFLDAGKTVRLTAEDDHGALLITCADDGPGFEGDPEEIFDPYHTRRPGARGLGLTIARRIVESLGGTVAATRLEPGSRFTVRIPAASLSA